MAPRASAANRTCDRRCLQVCRAGCPAGRTFRSSMRQHTALHASARAACRARAVHNCRPSRCAASASARRGARVPMQPLCCPRQRPLSQQRLVACPRRRGERICVSRWQEVPVGGRGSPHASGVQPMPQRSGSCLRVRKMGRATTAAGWRGSIGQRKPLSETSETLEGRAAGTGKTRNSTGGARASAMVN